MNVLTSDGIKLYVERGGEGIPCIYLHGGPGYWSKSFRDFTGEFLEKHMEMIYLDQRGCGRSAHDMNKNYSLERLLDDIEEVRKALHINEWYIMAHSFGGILAVNYANKYPERTKGMILLNVTLNMVDSFTHQISTGMQLLEIEDVEIPVHNLESFINLFYSIHGKLFEQGKYAAFQFTNLDNKKAVDKLDMEINTDPSFQNYIFTSAEYFQDFTKLTNQINVPVLVLAGENDHAIGPLHYQSFQFSNSVVSILKTAHHPYIENQEEYKESILRFMKL